MERDYLPEAVSESGKISCRVLNVMKVGTRLQVVEVNLREYEKRGDAVFGKFSPAAVFPVGSEGERTSDVNFLKRDLWS